MRMRRKGIRCGMVTLALIAAATSIVEPQTSATLDPIMQLRAVRPDGESRVVFTADSLASIDALAALIEQSGGRVRRRLPIINGLAATVANRLLPIFAGIPY